jgi:hypothetical protein
VGPATGEQVGAESVFSDAVSAQDGRLAVASGSEVAVLAAAHCQEPRTAQPRPDTPSFLAGQAPHFCYESLEGLAVSGLDYNSARGFHFRGGQATEVWTFPGQCPGGVRILVLI